MLIMFAKILQHLLYLIYMYAIWFIYLYYCCSSGSKLEVPPAVRRSRRLSVSSTESMTQRRRQTLRNVRACYIVLFRYC